MKRSSEADIVRCTRYGGVEGELNGLSLRLITGSGRKTP